MSGILVISLGMYCKNEFAGNENKRRIRGSGYIFGNGLSALLQLFCRYNS
jgi:hypothetical protein